MSWSLFLQQCPACLRVSHTLGIMLEDKLNLVNDNFIDYHAKVVAFMSGSIFLIYYKFSILCLSTIYLLRQNDFILKRKKFELLKYN